ncbi:hypothetical protein K2W90_05635 [Candidatus Babeliales bacterium]|nr:hypothetical protein [Candidatus Babeliales bacterium]
MKRYIARALLVLALQTGLCYASESQDAINALQTVASTANLPYSLNNKIDQAATFHEEELVSLIGEVFNFVPNTSESAQELEKAQEVLLTKLRSYKVTGFSFCIDPNFAFFVETQNPEFTVQYKNQSGEIKMRNYQAKINTIGFKIEASIKLDLILFVNTDMNFYDSNKAIIIGNGIDANLSLGLGVGITYASFANMAGGMLILSIPLLLAGPSLSYVSGGSLTPA